MASTILRVVAGIIISAAAVSLALIVGAAVIWLMEYLLTRSGLGDGQIFGAIKAIAYGVGGCVGYFFLSNWVVDKLFPATANNNTQAVRNLKLQSEIRPWLFLGPALLFLIIYLIYPAIQTFIWSFYDKSESFVGLDNYVWALNDRKFYVSAFNNILWLLLVPAACTFFGLIIAVLTDRIGWGTVARSLIFLPLAISFVGASVIWKFVYDFRDKGQDQIGLLNAFVTWLGGDPQVWIQLPFWNNFFLMAILIWIQTGFATVIVGAALRGVPEDTIEAAYIDGASPFKIFLRIVVPQIKNTILVVWTTITVLVLKIFDIVIAMTNGEWDTPVLAFYMYRLAFTDVEFGKSATVAMFLMLAVLPIMIWNIRQSLADGKGGH